MALVMFSRSGTSGFRSLRTRDPTSEAFVPRKSCLQSALLAVSSRPMKRALDSHILQATRRLLRALCVSGGDNCTLRHTGRNWNSRHHQVTRALGCMRWSTSSCFYGHMEGASFHDEFLAVRATDRENPALQCICDGIAG